MTVSDDSATIGQTKTSSIPHKHSRNLTSNRPTGSSLHKFKYNSKPCANIPIHKEATA